MKLETRLFEGKVYPVRIIGTEVFGTESFEEALTDALNSANAAREQAAVKVDYNIAFFVPDYLIDKSDAEILEYANENM